MYLIKSVPQKLDFLDMMINKYGSAKGYLINIGLTNEEIERITSKLI